MRIGRQRLGGGVHERAHDNKLVLHVNDRPDYPGNGRLPRATGRAGSRIHSLQDPGVESRTGQPGAGQRQEIVAGGDSGAAHRDHILGRPAGQPLQPPSPQLRGAKEAPLRVQIVGERVVDRTRHVSRHRVQRLDGSRKALGRPRIHQNTARILERLEHLGRGYRRLRLRPRGEARRTRVAPARIACTSVRCARFDRSATVNPSRESAVEHRDAGMTEPIQ